MTTLTQSIVKELLDYNPLTGALTWRKRARKWFPTDRHWQMWNTRFAGRLVGSNVNGYLQTRIFGRTCLVHRLIWFWMKGVWPTEIDHLDRKRWNNSWANLREATTQENAQNHSLRRDNTTGRVGVYWFGKLGKWQAQIYVDDRSHHLGLFETFEEAVAARVAAELEYGFNPGHGGRRQHKRLILRIAANKQYGYSPGHGRARLLTSNQERMRT